MATIKHSDIIENPFVLRSLGVDIDLLQKTIKKYYGKSNKSGFIITDQPLKTQSLNYNQKAKCMNCGAPINPFFKCEYCNT